MHVNTCKYRNFRSSSLIQFGELHASFNLSSFPSISAKSKIMVYMLSSIDLSNSVWWKVAVHPDWKMHPETGDLSLVCDCSCWRSWQASQTPRCVMVRAAAIRVEGGDREKEIEMVGFISPPQKKDKTLHTALYIIYLFFSQNSSDPHGCWCSPIFTIQVHQEVGDMTCHEPRLYPKSVWHLGRSAGGDCCCGWLLGAPLPFARASLHL